MNNLVEFHGQDQLVPALETLIGDEQPDLVVVRDFIPDQKILSDLVRIATAQQQITEELMSDAAPSLNDANTFVAEKWSEIGYKDYPVVEEYVLDEVRFEAINPHVDQLSQDFVFAIAQGSLCLHRQRLYQAERLPINYKTKNSTLDDAGYNSYFHPNGSFYEDLKNKKRKPRTETFIKAGDLALFAQHPSVVLHAVQNVDSKSSIAQLVSWRASTGLTDRIS